MNSTYTNIKPADSTMDKIAPEHRSLYKNSGLNSKELRKRRENETNQLRKLKRDDVHSKRRTINSIEDDNNMNGETASSFGAAGPFGQPLGSLPNNQSNSASGQPNDGDDLCMSREILDALRQNDNEQALIESAQKVRKILSKEPQPPFDEVIQSGLLPRLVELLDRYDNTVIQFEVAWILTNICSGTSEQTQIVVDHGSVPKLVNLLNSPDMRVREQAVWALGNIIGDCADLRDTVIGHGFVPKLLEQIRPEMDVGFLRNIAWVLVNLCRNKDPPPSLEIINQLIPYLKQLVHSTDLTILTDSTWAISYITELDSKYCQAVINHGLLVDVVPMLSHQDVKIQTAAIRALGSIVTGDVEQTQAVIDAGALPQLFHLISEHHMDRIVKEALWFISNIAAGSVEQIQSIIDNKLIGRIIYHIEHGDFNAKKESAWTIYNMSLSGTPEQLEHLVKEGVVPALCVLLKLNDPTIIRNTLETLNSILTQLSERIPNLCEIIEECGGLDLIEDLQTNDNPDIYHFAYTIIDCYFNENAEEQ